MPRMTRGQQAKFRASNASNFLSGKSRPEEWCSRFHHCKLGARAGRGTERSAERMASIGWL